MAERTPVILGLSRQAKIAGLPMPYFMAVGGLWMLPFIWFKWLPWIITLPLWYGLARAATIINPNGHRVVAVVWNKTRPPLSLNKKKRLRRYV
ncbi:VirB3 family type IV secretion system protein [Paracoccus pantotrophus]|uniref:VirB3 family type IV secretion system protein n=1 Tax=Paracoccus pantotrophus TaxID=82367 RepID=UPI0008E32520|nr:VirB3 family type IV secretion system protein [Paracoccus pantotrophus]MDF3855621.1 VirB3 family type IV secretion system protein [Paracoccus pantotrophus]SFP05397.1 Type IV secretory pathway, VirB3 components [Paracoccus pantotrophus]